MGGRDVPKVLKLGVSIYCGQREQIHRVSISTAQTISTAEAAACDSRRCGGCYFEKQGCGGGVGTERREVRRRLADKGGENETGGRKDEEK